MILSLLHLSRSSYNTESNYYNITFFEVENFICLNSEIFLSFTPLSHPSLAYFNRNLWKIYVQNMQQSSYERIFLKFSTFFWILPMLFSKLGLKYWFCKNSVFLKEVQGSNGVLWKAYGDLLIQMLHYSFNFLNSVSLPANQGYHIFLRVLMRFKNVVWVQ